jgi:polyisoprenyl-phosphate glycosyltransferase
MGEPTLDLSIVVPCYNEVPVLDELYRRASAAAREEYGSSYELLLVDDGSKDSTWSRIEALIGTDPRVVGVRLSRNHGHQLALTAGLSLARGEDIFILDADLQDPPELLSQMRALKIKENADVVFGRRRSREGEKASKTLVASMFYRTLARLTDTDIPLDTGDFRLVSRRVCDLLTAMPERDRFVRGMIAWLGFKQVPFEYDRSARQAGRTKYSLRRMVRLGIDALVSFSMWPLRVAGVMSFLLFVAFLGVAVYVLYSWLFLDIVRGWTSLAVIVLLASAVQLFSLSVMGEYLGRIYLQSKQRPLFLIADVRRHEPRP